MYQLEVCVDNLASAHAAVQAGADRLELCSALETGGLTPSSAFIEQCCQLAVPIHVLIRYRSGSFSYDAAEIRLMKEDIIRVRQMGAAGVVIGALTNDQALDLPGLDTLRKAAGDLKVTFHRAFDLVSDPFASLDVLVQLGFDYILTAGQRATADKGVALLKELVAYANSRIRIMVGSGVQVQNLKSLALQTGSRDFHGTFSRLFSHCQAQEYDAIGFSAVQKLSHQQDIASAKALLAELAQDHDDLIPVWDKSSGLSQ